MRSGPLLSLLARPRTVTEGDPLNLHERHASLAHLVLIHDGFPLIPHLPRRRFRVRRRPTTNGTCSPRPPSTPH